jgi:hypothetical protein
MRYTICTVRPAVAAAGDDGLLFPVPGAGPDSIALEHRDGSSVRELFARELSVRPAASRTPILRADDIRARVYVTDSRVAVACTKYDTGGGWIGGPIALTLNIASRVQAARRRRGKTLVGHVRYPWLRGVYASHAKRWRGTELLRLVVEGEGGPLRLDLALPRGTDAPAVAADVIRRAARFRLDFDEDATDDERAELETLARLESLEPSEGDELAGRDLPTSWPPTSRSALLGVPEPEAREVRDTAPPALATLVQRAPVAAPPPPDDVTVVLRRRAAEPDDDIDITLHGPPPRRDTSSGEHDQR